MVTPKLAQVAGSCQKPEHSVSLVWQQINSLHLYRYSNALDKILWKCQN